MSQAQRLSSVQERNYSNANTVLYEENRRSGGRPRYGKKTLAAPKRPKRYRPGMKALREIRKYQKSTELLLRKLPFARLCKEILDDVSERPGHYRFELQAISALQEVSFLATEAFMVQFLENASFCTQHRKRVTLVPRDILLVRRLFDF
ncbi:unnamed protein product [Gongylonema pulchrum]|uniref:Histone domain-containing protein n=1 Tax=Gongylonema pulchrum TaxID=637853 RepID=A0A183DQ97_9BILA|nr:unnamed protein product [Gongylonema pulchrum]